jgi:rhodanese-related sulfurtransferase/transcriptional regulator with XRE-family HTH domain
MRLVGPRELEALIAAADVDVVDVREPHEWARGHIPAARHVPLAALTANPGAALTRDNVVFVCERGGRSATAAAVAEKFGLKEVYSLEGGTAGWAAARLPLTVPEAAAKPASERASAEAPRASSNDEPAQELDAIVGKNLRDHRTRLGLSLDELAGRAGVSRTLLGQIELGRTKPSLGVTWRIAQTLGVPFSALLSTHGVGELRVLHAATAKTLHGADGRFVSRALFPFEEPRSAEFYELRLAGHGREDAEAHRPGTRENLVVQSGRLRLVVGAETVTLEAGDAVLFFADVPHSYINPGSDPCVMYLVMTYDEPKHPGEPTTTR